MTRATASDSSQGQPPGCANDPGQTGESLELGEENCTQLTIISTGHSLAQLAGGVLPINLLEFFTHSGMNQFAITGMNDTYLFQSACLCSFLLQSFDDQKFLIFMSSNQSIFSLYSRYFMCRL